jgi:hypothetical protein
MAAFCVEERSLSTASQELQHWATFFVQIPGPRMHWTIIFAILVAGCPPPGPLVISPTNGMWVKIDPLVTAAHTIGYSMRFLIAGLAAGFVLS